MAVINGTSGNDTLADTAGDDTINGLAGNDTIDGGSGGSDVVNGGDGRDWLQYLTATSGVVVDFAAGTVTGGAGSTSFTNIERFAASDFNDQLSGNASSQSLGGRGGSDTLWGAGGVDTLWGGAGADTFIFREMGTTNADGISDWSSGSDTLLLDGAIMAALGASGDFTAGDARFWASSTGTAHDADDRILYNSTTRQIFYDADGNGSGAAQLIATLQSGATLVATDIAVEGGSSSQVIDGTSGNDSLVGGAANDTINGFGGDDTLDGGEGFDSMDGGLGNDTYYSNQLADASNPGDVIVDAGGTDTLDFTGTIFTPLNVTLQDGIENLILRPVGFGAGTATGNSLNNLIRVEASPTSGYVETLDGAAGDDTIIGGNGDETFLLSAGNDFIDGGSDGISSLQATSAIVVDFGAGTATSAVGTTSFVNIGGVFGSAFNDVLIADDWWRLLIGGGGDDTVTGGSDGSSLHGGDGNDLVTGGAGNDFFTGGAGNDTLDGHAGDDTFHIMGGAGTDTIDGGEGNDVVELPAATSGVSVDLGAGTLAGGGTTGSTLISIESATGGDFDDLIVGSIAANRLEGDAGSDTLDGGAGNDTLFGHEFGGDWADTFRFSAAPGAANADLVQGFVSWEDRIVLDGNAHANSGLSDFGLDDARFWSSSTGTAHDADDRVIYNTSTGELWYDLDGTGSAAAQLIATLEGAPALTATDIDIINGSVPAGQVINGGAGNDSLAGGAGHDTLNGFGGDDTLDGGEGFDSMDGGLGNDTYYSNQLADASNPGDVIVDAGGTDTLTLTAMNPTATLPDGIENLIVRPIGQSAGTATGNSLNNLIRVETAPNTFSAVTVDGGAGDDTLLGWTGDETFVLSSGKDFIDGGGWSDTIFATSTVVVDFRTGTATTAVGTTSFVNIQFAVGSAFNDQLIADDDGRTLDGRGGHDTLTGGSSNDGLWGGDGNDLMAAGAGNDGLDGGAGNDTLDGGTGDDNFHIQGTAGSDTINGGDGNDNINMFSATSAINVDLSAGTLTGGGTSGSTLISIESFGGGAFDDLIVGSNAANSLQGEASSDTIDGGAGNDTLVGGQYSFSSNDVWVDTFRFSVAPGAANADLVRDFVSGRDQIVLDGSVHANTGPSGTFTFGDARFVANATGTAQDASDRVVYNTSNGHLWYDADGTGSGAAQLIAVVHTLVDSPASLTATDISIINGTAQSGQIINGTSGDDTLADTAGNDTINGLAGNDTVNGGNGGSDVVNGGDGRDWLQYLTATSGVVVDFAAGTVTGGAGSTSFTGIERFAASDFNDQLSGNAASQSLGGRGGSDTLAGAGGVDTLWGGAGADTFIFRENGTANADTIGDWSSGSDEMQLDNAAMGALGADGAFVAGDARFWASSTGTAQDPNDRVLFNSSNGGLYYDADGNGSGAAQLIATVQAGATVVATDISVI